MTLDTPPLQNVWPRAGPLSRCGLRIRHRVGLRLSRGHLALCCLVTTDGLVCSALWAETLAPRPMQVAASITISGAQRQKLVRLVRTDPEAGRLFQKLARLADASLDWPAHAIVRIETAGKLELDPAKAASRVALED